MIGATGPSRASGILRLLALFLSFGPADLALAGNRGAASGAQEPVAGMRIGMTSDVTLEGSLVDVPWDVRFAARTVEPTRAELRIQADGFRIEADIDLRAQVARLRGHGAEVSPDTRAALGALALAVERHLAPAERPLRVHENALYRLTAFLSEAPAGLTFSTHTVTVGGVGSEEALPGGVGQACQQADDDGIEYLSGGCAFQVYDGVCFDTLFQCFACGTSSNGCNAAATCPGRCGGGCGGLAGFGAYTRDCAEHDKCCGQNGDCVNPFSFFCGDEFWEAADDFFFGWILANCWGC